jgi:hypothetical protein
MKHIFILTFLYVDVDVHTPESHKCICISFLLAFLYLEASSDNSPEYMSSCNFLL